MHTIICHSIFSKELSHFDITEEKVSDRLCAKARGPDEISPAVSVDLLDVLACPVTRLLGLSLGCGQIPGSSSKSACLQLSLSNWVTLPVLAQSPG